MLVIYDPWVWNKKHLAQASTTNEWLVEKATNTELITWVADKYPDTLQLKMSVVSSSEILASSISTATTTSTTYTKLKEIEIKLPWTYTVSFDLANNPNNTWLSNWRIYKNWVALGTERSAQSATPSTCIESFSFASWDLVQVYWKENWTSDNCAISNFKILWLIIPDYTIPTVNL